jgi:hypothetical protein
MNNTENELNVFFQLVEITNIQMCSNDVINNNKTCIDNSSPFLFDGKCYDAPCNNVSNGKKYTSNACVFQLEIKDVLVKEG